MVFTTSKPTKTFIRIGCESFQHWGPHLRTWKIDLATFRWFGWINGVQEGEIRADDITLIMREMKMTAVNEYNYEDFIVDFNDHADYAEDDYWWGGWDDDDEWMKRGLGMTPDRDEVAAGTSYNDSPVRIRCSPLLCTQSTCWTY